MKKTRRLYLALVALALALCLTGCMDIESSYTFAGSRANRGALPVYQLESSDGSSPALPDPEPSVPDDSVTGETDDTKDDLSQYRANYNLGINRSLSGEVLVILLFVDDDVSYWNASDIKTFVSDQIAPALEYVEDNASAWGVELTIDTAIYSTVNVSGLTLKYEGTVNNGLDGAGMSKDVLEQAAGDMGFASANAMVSSHRQTHGYDEVAYVTLFNRIGRSYSRIQVANPSVEFAEHCVLFADPQGTTSSSRPYETRSATVAHELLHLFGAEDYYTPETRNDLLEQIYPNDIMLIHSTSLNNVTVGDLTAFTIGWTDTVPEICYNDVWTSS